MPDSTSKDSNEEPTKDSIDLSDLKSFSFGTQWTASSKSSSDSGGGRFNKGGPRGGDRPNRRPGSSGPPRKDRRPPRPTRSEGGPSDQSRQDQGSRGGESGRRQFGRGGRHDNQRAPFHPYESQVFDICFYPDDNCFSAIIKAMRTNHLTYELFHVAKLFMEKPDRFIASITRKPIEGQKPEKVFICASDNLPFASEEEVIGHAMAHHAEEYFNIEEVEVEPPSGNFPFVSRCPFTKVLLGPPNYHKYETNLRNHHMTRLPNMPFEKLQSSIETVREEEVVNEWLESQKKTTRYTAKDVAEGQEAKVFDSIEDAQGYLRTELRGKVVKQVNYARVSGSVLENFKNTEAFKAMDGERQRQQRFPLDTANAIRGRMRREKFSIYKKGSKGVTYVCSTKRNFRTPGQVMSPDLDRIIRFLEANQGLKSKDMPPLYEAWLKSEGVEEPVDEKKVVRDLHWLVADGYVSHFEDDTLFAQPVLETGAKSENAKAKHSPKAKAAEAAPAEKEGTKKTGEEAKSDVGESKVETEAEAKVETETSDTQTEAPTAEEAESTPEAKPEEPKPESAAVEEEASQPESAEKTPVVAGEAESAVVADVPDTQVEDPTAEEAVATPEVKSEEPKPESASKEEKATEQESADETPVIAGEAESVVEAPASAPEAKSESETESSEEPSVEEEEKSKSDA
ncbi:hypothetical protein VDG1235_4551 [Verrucomicrobiia bacterium DG1235]|nr:hypothetical protein VDG1235_4551 [Verrucomicrobiae bacterium DG1235]